MTAAGGCDLSLVHVRLGALVHRQPMEFLWVRCPGSCITPDVSTAVPGQGQALDISFPEENIPTRVQRSSVFVLFYYTPSDETKNLESQTPE